MKTDTLGKRANLQKGCPADAAYTIRASTQDNLSSRVCKSTNEQPVCPSAQTDKHINIIHFSESIISELATGEISIFGLVSVAG